MQHVITAMLVLACAANGCTPTLDWRESRPEGAGLLLMFPCKPAAQARKLTLAGAAVEMTLHACTAGGVTYALGHADVGQPQWVERALAELSAAAARNVGASPAPNVTPMKIPGMTPNPLAGRRTFAGQLADGQRVNEQLVLFAHGTRVFQATMVGANLDAEAIEMFFGALRLPS